MTNETNAALNALKGLLTYVRTLTHVPYHESIVAADRAIALLEASNDSTTTETNAALSALKPCSHCGVAEGDHDGGVPFLGTHWGEDGWYIGCSNCGSRSGERDERFKAVEAWNERALLSQEAQPEDLDNLAHELWAMAQLAPGEGIADGAARIAARLAAARPVVSREAIRNALSEGPVPVDYFITHDAMDLLVDHVFALQLKSPQPSATAPEGEAVERAVEILGHAKETVEHIGNCERYIDAALAALKGTRT